MHTANCIAFRCELHLCSPVCDAESACLAAGRLRSRTVGRRRETAPAAAAPEDHLRRHVRPILREHCYTCHNQDTAKSDLAMDSYAKLMAGGSSGEVVIAGRSGRLAFVGAGLATRKCPTCRRSRTSSPTPSWRSIRSGSRAGRWRTPARKRGDQEKAVVRVGDQRRRRASRAGPPPCREHLWRAAGRLHAASGAVTALAASPWAPLVAIAGQKRSLLYNTDTLEDARRVAVSRRDALLPAVQPQRLAAVGRRRPRRPIRLRRGVRRENRAAGRSRSATSSTWCWPATSTTISR